MNEENLQMKNAVVSIRSVLRNREIKTIPTFIKLCQRMGGNAVLKGDVIIVTAPEADAIKKYIEGTLKGE